MALATAPALGACGGAPPPTEDTYTDELALMADHVTDPHDLPLDTTVTGVFDRHQRVYGFTFEAKAGATIRLSVETRAGREAKVPGATLDTIAAVFAMPGDRRGERLAQEDDGAGGTQAALPAVAIKQDGKYLLVFSSWDDPGLDGSFTVRASCDGTDYQCRRPVPANTCVANTRYVQGGTVIGTETWNDCTIVLLETVKVAAGAVLTIRPGVTVKGNYIGTGAYGTVGLEVEGALQAVGTKDQPVVFTALQAGWVGISLKGASSTLRNVYIEKAQRGVSISGSGNTLRDVNINSGDLGLVVTGSSADNRVERLRVAQTNSGVLFEPNGSATIDDSVILGKGNGSGIGIESRSQNVSQFRRAYVAGFADGLRLDGSALEVYDGTITKNTRGVTITGPNAGVKPPYTCPTVAAAPPVVYTPPTPPYLPRDPVFVRTDITKNTEYGVKLLAPELFVVEESNVSGNGAGIIVESDSLHPDSRVVRSNVFNNGASVQVESSHVNGRLNISGNYWAKISDPELSTSWRMTHSIQRTCTAAECVDSRCGSSYTCGAQVYQGGRYVYPNCTATVTASWNGQFTFTGFSPVELSAGPRLADLSDEVKAARGQ
jgi:hypothetical protein